MMSKHFQAFKFGLGAITLAVSGLAQADVGSVTIDVTGILSNGEFGSAGNTVMTFNIGAGAHVTDIGFNGSMTAFDPSFLSEMAIVATQLNDLSTGASLTPGLDHEAPGTISVNASYHLADYGLDFHLAADGILRVEFAEDYPDGASPDGIWNSGLVTIRYETITAVPEPASYGLMALGLAGLGVVARRRRMQ